MLPRISVEMPSLPALPSLPELPTGLASGFPWGWIAGGAVLTVISLWALRRARRLVVAAAVGVAGLLVAWNAGFLPLTS